MTREAFEALDRDFEVCMCVGTTLGEIVDAIQNGCDTIKKIMEETDAGTACELCQSREIDDGEDRELHLDEILEYAKG